MFEKQFMEEPTRFELVIRELQT